MKKSFKPIVSSFVNSLPLALLLMVIMPFAIQAQTDEKKKVDSDDSRKVDQAYIREYYTKYEYDIPMRDGVKLFTAVYEPKDNSQTYPIILTRTPYSLKPYSVDLYPNPRGPILNYAKERFIFVVQDVRGS